MNIGRRIHLLALCIFIIAIQLLAEMSGSRYILTQLTMTGYYTLVVLGLCLLMGYAGQVSLGHAAFFALGGYLTALFSSSHLDQLFTHENISILRKAGIITHHPEINNALCLAPIVSLGIVLFFTLILALIIGIPLLRLKGHYLSMATLGFGIIVHRIFLGTKIFGEADGIANVAPFRIFGFFAVGGDASHRIANFYFAWFLVLCAIIILRNIINSRVGRALRAIHDSEEAASAMGVDVGKYKLIVFAISALFAAIGGFFMTHYNTGIGPSEAGIMKSVRYVAIVAVGGMANLWGCLIMGTVLNFFSLRGFFGSYDDAVFGALLIGIMIWAPDGLFTKEFSHKFRHFVEKIRCQFSK
ncbi:MAG: branched-chain amino acid ABC transporter permease [Spirochaetes bacterium]|nr:branched-chain amino acid ABC transporter permease [Spirochaetota bacterium]